MNKHYKLFRLIYLTLLLFPGSSSAEMISPRDKAGILSREWASQNTGKLQYPQESSAIKPGSVVRKNKLPQIFDQKISFKGTDLPLIQLLKPIAQSAGMNLIMGPGVENKKMDVDFSDITLGAALDNLMYLAGYGWRLNNKDLVVLAQETRVFRILLPPVSQGFNDVTSNETFVQSAHQQSTQDNARQDQIKLGAKVVVENKSEGISFWDDVQANLKTFISSKGQFSINKPAGVVIVSDTPFYLNRIAQYFEDMNTRIAQQIEVDIKVVEVKLNKENRYGVDWHALAEDLKGLNSISMATNFASGHFSSGQYLTLNADGSNPGSGLNSNGIALAINALKKQGRVEVVSQPRVTMLNNQVSVIQVGSTQSFVDRTTVESTQTGTITSVSTSQVQEGVTMRLLGNMVGHRIYLSVTPVVTTIDAIRSIQSGNTIIEAPQTTTKSINTTVKLNEGETVAIGGLITSYKSKNKESVPILSKIPIIGKLFEYNEQGSQKTELVVFITPRKG